MVAGGPEVCLREVSGDAAAEDLAARRREHRVDTAVRG
jgi:hypothetical protein